ncbi:hypothetical protein ACWAT4_21640 [Bradyrhizobium manausense]
MIRDPSDGSVREEITPQANQINAVAPKTPPEGISGLRAASPKDKYQARLEWSRGWMKAYHASKDVADAGGEHDDSAATSEG